MTEHCAHAESFLPPGRSVTTVCYRCGHVGYEPLPKDKMEVVVKMVNIPEGTVYDRDVMRRFHDAIFKAFSVPTELLNMDEPIPDWRIRNERLKKYCIPVNDGGNNE